MALQTAPARQNLPVETDSFIGRDRDLSDLLRLLDADRVVTLSGADGIGKTRLALRLAAHATASFPDGVWLADLSGLDTRAEVAARIAAAVGVTEEALADPVENLCETLRRRALLLVLDDCDAAAGHVAEVAAALVAGCPALSLLLTASEPLRVPGERVWRVPPLTLPREGADPAESGAVRLFLDRAAAAAPGFTVDPAGLRAVARVCERLGGVPLAVELVAAWAGRVPLDRLAEGLAAYLPAAPGRRHGRAARLRLVEGVLAWSHALLSGPERVLLRRLSVFPDWDLEGAERVCGGAPLEEPAVLDLLSGLVDRALVALTGEHHNRVRYRLPGAVRRFAAARLAESGEADEVGAAHTARMAAVAEELGRIAMEGRPMPWAERFGHLQRVVSEYGNMRAALLRAERRGDAASGLRLCAGLRTYWVLGHHFGEAGAWCDSFLPMAGGDDALRAPVLVLRAQVYRAQRRYAEAARAAARAEELGRAAGDAETVGQALNVLADLDVRDGAYARARERAVEVLESARSTGDLWNEAVALALVGAVAVHTRELGEADTRFNTALMIMRGMDHRWGVGLVLMAQGAAAEVQGDAQSADRCYREALDIQRGIGSAPEIAAALAGVGRIAPALGSVAQSYDYLSESLLVAHAAGHRPGVAHALTAIAKVALEQGAAADALRCAGAAAALRGGLDSELPDPLRLAAPAGVGADPEQVRAWWEEGGRLGLDAAVDLALRITESGRPMRPRPAPTRLSQPPRTALTPREHEIAQLIGQGQSNRVISENLFITQATVARHVANINRKMGFNSRRQIAAWVNRHAVSP
ncbi:LuxR C-terminal-related transcriptional regulator [Streptomonospora sp. S1-112]|uniref:LuxR C-terminal-related transcriptional regulator n=1 Tax=Streptomonospora mangrovi TaxID=2883123 RepID=A0A9X3NIF8_9ACTN|nr:LuxR C-terminal-related transcriptional regulator [Streptomonospora mangrovi]MDA0562743.1 LuxR C-terminal-related transcriptional regulator [Streptomonospora mangrovi]